MAQVRRRPRGPAGSRPSFWSRPSAAGADAGLGPGCRSEVSVSLRRGRADHRVLPRLGRPCGAARGQLPRAPGRGCGWTEWAPRVCGVVSKAGGRLHEVAAVLMLKTTETTGKCTPVRPAKTRRGEGGVRGEKHPCVIADVSSNTESKCSGSRRWPPSGYFCLTLRSPCRKHGQFIWMLYTVCVLPSLLLPVQPESGR